MHRHQIHKILIFTHDGGTRLSSGLEDLQVTGIPKAKRGNGLSGKRKGIGEPESQLRRQLGVNPQNQEVTMGWFTRPLANLRQA